MISWRRKLHRRRLLNRQAIRRAFRQVFPPARLPDRFIRWRLLRRTPTRQRPCGPGDNREFARVGSAMAQPDLGSLSGGGPAGDVHRHNHLELRSISVAAADAARAVLHAATGGSRRRQSAVRRDSRSGMCRASGQFGAVVFIGALCRTACRGADPIEHRGDARPDTAGDRSACRRADADQPRLRSAAGLRLRVATSTPMPFSSPAMPASATRRWCCWI